MLLSEDIDFLAVRQERTSPDDIVMHTYNHEIPEDVVSALKKAKSEANSPETIEEINSILAKYAK